MRYFIFVLGLFILTFGISLTILSNLGTSPFDALLVGLANSVGLTVGSWEVILALLMIFLNALLQKRKPELLGMVTAFITGVGIDLWLYLLSHQLSPQFWYSKTIIFGLGLVIIGLGTAIYLFANFAPIPIDRLTLILKELMRTNLFISRTIIYAVFLVLAFIFGGPIGIGTILTVSLGGLVLNFFMPIVEKVMGPIINKPSQLPTTFVKETSHH